MVAAIRCQDLTLEGLTLTDSPNWHLDLYCCDRVRMHGVKIASDPRLPNNDGVDISGSQDVTVSNLVVDNQAPVMFSRPIHLDLRRDAKTGRIGAMRRIQIANVVARTPGRILMTSQEGGWLEDVRLFRPDYDRPRPCSFAALWARNVHGGWRAPLAGASEPNAPAFDQDEFTRRNLTRAD